MVLFVPLERWDREGVREMQEGGDVGVLVNRAALNFGVPVS